MGEKAEAGRGETKASERASLLIGPLGGVSSGGPAAGRRLTLPICSPLYTAAALCVPAGRQAGGALVLCLVRFWFDSGSCVFIRGWSSVISFYFLYLNFVCLFIHYVFFLSLVTSPASIYLYLSIFLLSLLICLFIYLFILCLFLISLS